MALTVGIERAGNKSGAGFQRYNRRVAGDPGNPSALMLSPMAQDDPPEESWPWFSGKLEDLMWFKQAWEDYARQFHPGLSEEALVKGLQEYCMARDTGKIIRKARSLAEVWLLLETHSNSQTAFIEGLTSQLLEMGRMVNDTKTLAYYNRVLRAIQEAKTLERAQDFLTTQSGRCLAHGTPEEGGQLLQGGSAGRLHGGSAGGLLCLRPETGSGVKLEWCRGEDYLRDALVSSDNLEGTVCAGGPLWRGPHAGGVQHIEELSPKGWLAVIQKKQLCHFCFRHSGGQPCRLTHCPLVPYADARACTTGCCMMHCMGKRSEP